MKCFFLCNVNFIILVVKKNFIILKDTFGFTSTEFHKGGNDKLVGENTPFWTLINFLKIFHVIHGCTKNIILPKDPKNMVSLGLLTLIRLQNDEFLIFRVKP